MKPVLIGVSNPHSRDPRDALLPYPKNCSGWRLWKMLNEVSGASKADYADAFERRNLDQMHRPLGSLFRGRTVVLLGEEVRRAFQLPKLLIHPRREEGVTYRQVPHPSGRCHFYNDPVCRRLVGLMLEDLINGG